MQAVVVGTVPPGVAQLGVFRADKEMIMTNFATAAGGETRAVTVAERAMAAGQAGALDRNAVLWALAAAELWFASDDEPAPGSLPESPMSVSRPGGAPTLALFTDAALLEPWRGPRVRVRAPGFELFSRMPPGTGFVVNPGHSVGLEVPADGVASIVAMIERHGGSRPVEPQHVNERGEQSEERSEERGEPVAGTTSPGALPRPLQQAALIRTIGETVGSSLPPGWTSARFVAGMTAAVSTFAVWITRDGAESKALAPRTASKAAKQLRELMYEPGKGTWFTMTMTLHSQGAADTDFDYEREPDFAPVPIDDVAFVSDQQLFPRDADHIPGWLRAKLGS